MNEVMKNLGKYLRKKKLEMNVEKAKMIVFDKRKRKNEENDRKEIVRKANKAVGCVWGIGERKWGDDFRRRMMMFESMIESILIYRAEIWGGWNNKR
ncbi:hypothetical protein MTP99_013464 [Tenebrio molitor]|nr:hypothetical protein MTP99_013464 [Tenebrio molitor]